MAVLFTAKYNTGLSIGYKEDINVNKKKVLVCSAWPYASGVPHLGNLVSSLLSGDVFARYYRLRGHEVLYVSGTDAHGARIEYEAMRLGISPAQLSLQQHKEILSVLDAFGIEFDIYTTTESPTHKRFVRNIYLQMEQQGYITRARENRAYCGRCQMFLADRFITGMCPRCGANRAMGNQCSSCGAILEPEELINPACSICEQSNIEFRSSQHWYLDLPKLTPLLTSYINGRELRKNVYRFTKQMLDEGLRPRAMTRDISWGIPAPFAGAEGKVIYVWGEAALGYVSATIEHFGGEDKWKEFWFGDDVWQIYTIGKDNIPFHTLIFPGQLLASGKGYHLPDQIAATEYLNWIDGSRFSKSRGVGLYCDQAAQVMDPELWRFYLLHNRPEERDVNFSWQELAKAINGIFISNVANLTNRVLSFIQTRYKGEVPSNDLDPEVIEHIATAISEYEAEMSAGNLSRALRTTCALAIFGNEYFQRKEPWSSDDRRAVTSAFHLVKAMTVTLLPFVPRFAGSVLAVMGISCPSWETITRVADKKPLTKERVLIPPIDIDEIEERTRPPKAD